MNKKIEFNNIISDIIKNDKFIKMKDENHHGISRLEHSLNVAKVSYMIAKKFKSKQLVETTRAALLHDFYINDELINKVSLIQHPKVAARNAKKIFKINNKQYNAIVAHMFPFSVVLPTNMISLNVTLSDKIVAIYECLRYKMPLKAGIYTCFLFNFIFVK